MLQVKHITAKSDVYTYVKKLYKAAFPKEERIPMCLLMWRARVDWIQFLAFYDDGKFCGMAYIVYNNTLLDILYLAVDEKFRSQGYGQQILTYLAQSYKRTIVLEVELPDKKASNYEQQIRRKAFYLRNGFMNTGYGIDINKVSFEILKNKPEFQKEDWEYLRKTTWNGIMKPTLYERNENKNE